MNVIGDNIKKLRESMGMTQADIADIAGVSGQAVSNWELGTKIPRMGYIQRIADHFGLKKSDIIEGDATSAIKSISDDETKILIELYNGLSAEKKKLALQVLEGLRGV
jgi:repressor LexA